MPNLYGSNPQKDIQMFDEVLYNPLLQADQIKIYPVSVVRGPFMKICIKAVSINLILMKN